MAWPVGTAVVIPLVAMSAVGGVMVSKRIYQTNVASQKGNVIQQTRVNSLVPTKYTFINPLLTCEVMGKNRIAELSSLKEKVDELIKEQAARGDISTASVYFDTRDGQWFGVNGKELYSPASLLKVPTMIAMFKLAEEDPTLLQKQVRFEGKNDLTDQQYFKPSHKLEPRHLYSIRELVEYMVVYSDNNPVAFLLPLIGEERLNEIYTDLGVPAPVKEGEVQPADFVTVKSYANFFRVLYNATYLSREMSEQALSLLSKTDFTKGISAGVPADMVIAQKFGERIPGTSPSDSASERELHDCGIIYYPEHPYLLCVMTKGKDFEKMTTAIKEISASVFKHINDEHKVYPVARES